MTKPTTHRASPIATMAQARNPFLTPFLDGRPLLPWCGRSPPREKALRKPSRGAFLNQPPTQETAPSLNDVTY